MVFLLHFLLTSEFTCYTTMRQRDALTSRTFSKGVVEICLPDAPAVGSGSGREPDRYVEDIERISRGVGELFSFEPLFYTRILP